MKNGRKVADEALVIFLPSGRRGRFPLGTPLLSAARLLGVDIDSVCGGRGLCGRCQVTPSLGEFAKFGVVSEQNHLSPTGDVEREYSEKRGLAPGRRLACSACIAGDAVIDVPQESQIHKQIIRKRAETHAVEIDPVVKLHYVVVKRPGIHDQSSDSNRLRSALKEQWGLDNVDYDLGVLQSLSGALRAGEWSVTVSVREGRQVIGVWPGFRDRGFGLAIDVGTTTIAAHLCDLESGDVIASSARMNPQIRFGEDVMSRISFVQMNPDVATEPTAVVREAIQSVAVETAAQAGIDPTEILELAVVGNPTMHHLLIGLDPQSLGSAPFSLVVDTALEVRTADLGIAVHPGARAYALPCIAGHVGADTAGVILAEGPQDSDALTLIVDVGTNAEIVLGNRHRLLACSSPTGPAFEGAQISCGQRAALGAIERMRVDPVTLEPRFRVIGCEQWSNEPGFKEAIADIGVTGICGSGIIEAIAEMHMVGLINRSGLIDGAGFEECPNVIRDGALYSYRLYGDDGRDIVVTQTDVRAIQLAKAALYAGTRLLMDRMGVDAVDRIVLAGAFGSYIDPLHAMALGMIPDCDLNNVSAAGNAAGTGARIALLSRRARLEIEALVRRVEKVETAAEQSFRSYYVGAMAIPHSSHKFPTLERALVTRSRASRSRSAEESDVRV